MVDDYLLLVIRLGDTITVKLFVYELHYITHGKRHKNCVCSEPLHNLANNLFIDESPMSSA